MKNIRPIIITHDEIENHLLGLCTVYNKLRHDMRLEKPSYKDAQTLQREQYQKFCGVTSLLFNLCGILVEDEIQPETNGQIEYIRITWNDGSRTATITEIPVYYPPKELPF